MNKFYIAALFLLCSYLSFGQTKGLIYKPASTAEGRAVLDPNSDGYTSKTTGGFKNNDRGNGESEINYKSIPILDTEPIQDPLRGPGCGFTDMVDSGIGDPVMFHFDGVNFLVRFRLNKTSPNSKGYSVLIDTDQKFGFSGPNADPNAVTGNPGFELELVLQSNHSVSLYNIDGTTNPQLIVSKSYESHSQKSIAYTEQCGDMDYFYDFYMPWSAFGLPADTKLRMSALTVMNPRASTGNNAKSDVGGVDDKKYGENYDKIFEDFVQNFNPTSPQDIASGTIKAKTLCPTVNGSLLVTSTTIAGTSTEAAGTVITVYKNNVAFASKPTVNSDGTWSMAVSGLVEGDVITASAKASGKEESESNCSGVLVGQVCTRPAPPILITSPGNSNKYLEIKVTEAGKITIYFGNNTPREFPVTANTTYYYCEAQGLITSKNGCNSISAGVYRVTFTNSGGCSSNSVIACVNGIENSITPKVDGPITTSSKLITGTAVANAQVILKVSGAEVVRLRADALGKWSVPASSISLLEGALVSAYALEDGKCQSADAVAVTVTKPVSAAPAITGTYCGGAGVITGVAPEAGTIELFVNGTSAGTTTTDQSGKWSFSRAVSVGAVLTAKATVSGKTQSAASAPVTVRAVSYASDITVDATTGTDGAYIMENTSAITGSGPGGTGTVSLYLDEMFIGKGTLSGGRWSVTKAANPGDFYLYAGAKLSATFTAADACESDHKPFAIAIRCAPPVNKPITPASMTLCTGSIPKVTVKESEPFVIYQLYNGTVPVSSSMLGTGGDIQLEAGSPFTTTTPNTVYNLSIVASKIPYVKEVTCELPLAEQVIVTLNPEIKSNTISLSGSGNQYCGATDVGTITGSTPTGGDENYTYQWQRSADNTTWTDIADATAKDYSPGVVAATTYFRRKVFSGACSNVDASASVQVLIRAAVTNTITYTGEASFCGAGTPSEIKGNVDPAFVSYKWQHSPDGITYQDISGATAEHYSPGNLTQTTFFRRVVSNGTCESFSTPVTIKVEQAIDNNKLTVPASVLLCAPANVGEIVGSVPTGGNNTYTYRWQKSTDNGISFEDILPAVTTRDYTPGAVSATTLFRRIATSGTCGESESDVVKITVVSVAKTTLGADKDKLAADGTSSTTVRVQLRDEFGTVIITDGCNLQLTTDKGTITNIEYAGNGAYTAIFTAGIEAGIASISGTIGGVAIANVAEVTLEPVLMQEATSLTASPSVVQANGVNTSLVTLAFKDYAGNPFAVAAGKVELLMDGVAVATEDKGNGVFTYAVPARSAEATLVFTAKYDGILLNRTAVVKFEKESVKAPSLTNTTVSASPVRVSANGMNGSKALVQFKGDDGANMEVEEAKVQLFIDNTAVTYTYRGGGLFEVEVPARVAAGTVEVTAMYNGTAVNSKAEVEFIPVINPDATVIAASPTTVNADGISTSIITISFKDYANNPINVDPAKVSVNLSGLAEAVPTEPTGATGMVKATVPARTTAATVIATASYEGVALNGSVSIAFVPALDLSKTVVSAAPETVSADGKSTATATVEFRDYDGKAISVEAGKVQLLLDNETVTVTNNGTGVFTATVPARVTEHTVKITAKYNGTLAADNAAVSFTAAVNLAATEVLTSPATVNADGESTSTAQVIFKDYAGNSIAVEASDVEVLLDGVVVAAVKAGTTGVFTATVPARTAGAKITVSARYKGTATGGHAAVNFVPVVNLNASILAATPVTVNADGKSTSKATLTFKDYAGNAIDVIEGNVAILIDNAVTPVTALGSGVFEVTVPARKVAQTVQVNARYDNTTLTSSASVTFIPTVDLTATEVSASPATVKADNKATSTATVAFKDHAGNPIAVNSNLLSILADGVELTGLLDKGNGVFEAVVPARAIAADVQVSARYSNESLHDKATVTFVPAVDLAATSVSASPATVDADGKSTSLATVIFRDFAGKTMNVDLDKVTISLNNMPATVIAVGGGEYTAVIPARTKAEAVVVSVKYDNIGVTSTATVTFVPVVNLAATTIAANPNTVNADGKSISTAQLTFKDYAGEPISVVADQVEIRLNGASVVATPTATGKYAATVPAQTEAGTVQVTAQYKGVAVGSSDQVEFVPVVNPAATVITTSPAQVAADGKSTAVAMLQFKDFANKPINVAASQVEVLLNGTSVTATLTGTGSFTVAIPARTVADVVEVKAKYNNVPLTGSATVNFISVINFAATQITANPTTVPANGTAFSLASVTFKDYAGNGMNVDAAKLEMLQNGVGATFSPKGNGVYETVVPARTTAEAVALTARYEGALVADNATVVFEPVLNILATTLTAEPAIVNADGASTSLVQVNFKDHAGNAITLDDSKVAILLNGVAAVVVSKGNGTYEAIVPARRVAEKVEVTALYDGVAVNKKATVEFIPTIDLAATIVAANPSTVQADGTSTSTATVTFKDFAGNPIAVEPGKVSILLSGAEVTAVAGAVGVFSAEIPARTTPATINITAVYNGVSVSSTASVTFVPTVNLAATTLTATPAVVAADGNSSATATLVFRDYAGNPVAVTASEVEILADNVLVPVASGTLGNFTAVVPGRTEASLVELTARYKGSAVGGKPTVEFVPSVDKAATVISASPVKVGANGKSTSTVTVQFKDYAGNPVAVDLGKVNLLLDGAPVALTSGSAGVFTAVVPARETAATVSVTATYDGMPVGGSAAVIFIPAVDLTATTVHASPEEIAADGVSASAATVQFRDYAGNPIAVDASVVEILLDGKSVSILPGKTGEFTVTVPGRTMAATVTVTARYAGNTTGNSTHVMFVPAVNLSGTVVTASPEKVSADGVSVSNARVSFMDYAGEPVAVDASKVNLMAGGEVLSGLQEKGKGVFEAVVPARTIAGKVEVTAKYEGTTIASRAEVEFIPLLSTELSTATASPATVVADGVASSLVTVQLKSRNGSSFITNELVKISSTLGTIEHVTDNGNGNYTALLTSTTAGVAAITVQVGTSTLADQPKVTFVPGNVSGTYSLIAASEPVIPADGQSSVVIPVTLFDTKGNRITRGGDKVELFTTLGTLGEVKDHNDGTYSTLLTAGKTRGTAVISGTVNGFAISNIATVEFAVAPVTNRAPVAAADAFTVNNHEKLTGNVLLNDTDPDGHQLSVKSVLVRRPMFGSVVMMADGNFTYTPNKGYIGEDSFAYEVCDNGDPVMCAQANVSIQVKQGQVFVPEGFSPDGDGVNDVFVIYGAEEHRVSLKVFNRWGDIVYENDAYKNDWNGTASKGFVIGDKLPDGTYFYVIDLNNGEKPRTHSLIIKRK